MANARWDNSALKRLGDLAVKVGMLTDDIDLVGNALYPANRVTRN